MQSGLTGERQVLHVGRVQKKKNTQRKKPMQSSLASAAHAVHVGRVQKKIKIKRRPCKAVSPARDMRCTSAEYMRSDSMISLCPAFPNNKKKKL
jgi:hypothetical protein